MEFVGTEKFGFELFGTMPVAGARDRTGGNVKLDEKEGRVAVAMSFISLVDVRPRQVPLTFSYTAVLWRIAVVLKKKSTWLMVSVDIDQTVPRMMCSFLMGYPTRSASIDLSEKSRAVDMNVKAGSVSCALNLELNTSAPPPPDKRALAVRDAARFFIAPWGSAMASSRQGAYVKFTDGGLVTETLSSAVTWDESGTVWKSREHLVGSPEAMALI